MLKPYHETEHGVLYHGNCLDIMPMLDKSNIDLVLTDPPYGINLEYSDYIDTEDNWYRLIENFIPLAKSISKMLIMPSCKISRLPWIYTHYPPDWLICWYKGSVGHNSYIGFNDWEPLLVYGRTRNKLCMHDYFQTQSSPKMGSYGHPCPKPIDWSSWLVDRATEDNNIVCDPFGGSGTTALSCIDTKRRYILIELDEKYCEISAKRIESHLQEVRLF